MLLNYLKCQEHNLKTEEKKERTERNKNIISLISTLWKKINKTQKNQ